jgi:hypothetical protein
MQSTDDRSSLPSDASRRTGTSGGTAAIFQPVGESSCAHGVACLSFADLPTSNADLSADPRSWLAVGRRRLTGWLGQ